MPETQMPEDQLVQLFPGADHPNIPVASLVTVKGTWEPEPPPNFVYPGAVMICRAAADTVYMSEKLYFTVGIALPDTNEASESVLVQWLVPGKSKAGTFKPGRKKEVVDHFGAWEPLDDRRASELQNTKLPSVEVPRGDILLPYIELEDGCVPYKALDALRHQHAIDITGLSVACTQRGNLYRQYVLMNG
jgi:hypothetical protein